MDMTSCQSWDAPCTYATGNSTTYNMTMQAYLTIHNRNCALLIATCVLRIYVFVCYWIHDTVCVDVTRRVYLPSLSQYHSANNKVFTLGQHQRIVDIQVSSLEWRWWGQGHCNYNFFYYLLVLARYFGRVEFN